MEQKIRHSAQLSDNLRRLRYDNGYSQETLCAELQRNEYDISRSTYAKYESNLMNIRVDVLVALQKIYGCDYSEFFKNVTSYSYGDLL